jgi:Putative transposase
MGALFRGKLLAKLRDAHGRHELAQAPDAEAFAQLLNRLHRTNWIVYAKRPFGGAEQVVRYLGRYTHRIGISNQRLVSLDNGEVTFRTKNGKRITLPAEEFLARFVQHVLPSGFVKIRHYGLLAPSHATTSLETARGILQQKPSVRSVDRSPAPTATSADVGWRELLRQLTGIDLGRCPACGATGVVRRPLEPQARAPPEAA